MIRLDRPQRDALSYTVRELANFAATALVLAQLVADEPRMWLIVAGVVTWLAFVGVALLLEGGR